MRNRSRRSRSTTRNRNRIRCHRCICRMDRNSRSKSRSNNSTIKRRNFSQRQIPSFLPSRCCGWYINMPFSNVSNPSLRPWCLGSIPRHDYTKLLDDRRRTIRYGRITETHHRNTSSIQRSIISRFRRVPKYLHIPKQTPIHHGATHLRTKYILARPTFLSLRRSLGKSITHRRRINDWLNHRDE